MFDIVFTNNGQKNCTKVEENIHIDLPIENSILLFTLECGTQYAAAILVKHLTVVCCDCGLTHDFIFTLTHNKLKVKIISNEEQTKKERLRIKGGGQQK